MKNFISKLFTITLFEAVLCLSIVTMVNVVLYSFNWQINDVAVIAANMMGLLILAYAAVSPSPGARLTHTASEFPLLDAMAVVTLTAFAAKFAHGVVIGETVQRNMINVFLVFLGAISFMYVKKRYELEDRLNCSTWNDLQEARLHNLELRNAYLKGLVDASMARTQQWRDLQVAREKAAEESVLAAKREWEADAEPLLNAARSLIIFAESKGHQGVAETMAGVNRFCVDEVYRSDILNWLKEHHMQDIRDNSALLRAYERWLTLGDMTPEVRASLTFTLDDLTSS